MRWLTHLSDSTLQWPHEARAQTHSFGRCLIRNCSHCEKWMSSLSRQLGNEMNIYTYIHSQVVKKESSSNSHSGCNYESDNGRSCAFVHAPRAATEEYYRTGEWTRSLLKQYFWSFDYYLKSRCSKGSLFHILKSQKPDSTNVCKLQQVQQDHNFRKCSEEGLNALLLFNNFGHNLVCGGWF